MPQPFLRPQVLQHQTPSSRHNKVRVLVLVPMQGNNKAPVPALAPGSKLAPVLVRALGNTPALVQARALDNKLAQVLAQRRATGLATSQAAE